MKVSVIVPVYNKAPWLRECFDSILAQTYGDFELIAVDDASTDDGLAILRSIDDPRLRVVALPANVGPSGAVQRGMDMARGEYIVRMDADDRMVPERIARQVELMDANPDVIASGGQARLFGDEHGVYSYPLTDAECRAQVLFGVPVLQGTSILRTTLLRAHDLRYQDHWPRIGEDWLFWAVLARHGRFANLDEPLIEYRRGEQNSTHGVDMVDKFKPMVELLLPLVGLPHTPMDVSCHLAAIRVFDRRPDKAFMRSLRAWFDGLKKWNRETGFCHPSVFDHRVEAQWQGLFFLLPSHGIAPAWNHLALSGEWPKARLAYLAKYTLNRWLGRAPNE